MTGATGHTVAIAAHKGGVGKTTTAIAVAAGLARAGEATLLVDLDPQGHSTMGLDVELEGDWRGFTVRELFVEESVAIAQLAHVTPVPNLYVVSSDIRLERAAQWLYGRPRREAILARALLETKAAGLYRWIVLDCPPSLGPLVENALAAADRVIIPCRMEARATDGLVDLVDILQILRPAFDDWRILRTQRDERNTRTNAAIDAALEAYAPRLLETIIPRSEALNQAQIARQDIYEYSAHSPGALAYFSLCQELRRWSEVASV